MGYGANCEYTIKDRTWLDDLELKGWDILKDTTSRYPDEEYEIWEFLRDDTNPLCLEGIDEVECKKIADSLYQAWKLTQIDFALKTGLSLDVLYHLRESEGSSYDEIEGLTFTVSGVEILSKAGKAAVVQDKIEKSFWVTYG
jgi:hypothetical protein